MLAQLPGDERRLLAGARHDVHGQLAGCPGVRSGDPSVRRRAAQPGHNPSGGCQQRRTAATGNVELNHLGRRAVGGPEPVREAPDDIDVCAAECVDRLVRVADDHQIAAAAGQQGQQLLLRRVGILVLVDDQEPTNGPFAVEQRRLGVQEVDRGSDEFRRVVRRRPTKCGDPGVLTGKPGNGEPVVTAQAPSERRKLRGTHSPLYCAHQQVTELLGEPASRQRRAQTLRP